VCCAGERTGVSAANHFAYGIFHNLERQPVTARGKSVAALAVDFVVVWIPVSLAHAVDYFGRDGIAFDGQRVIGVVAVNLVEAMAIRRLVFREARWLSGIYRLRQHASTPTSSARVPPSERIAKPAMRKVAHAHQRGATGCSLKLDGAGICGT
jgi:CRP-like cAMP-binding protein